MLFRNKRTAQQTLATGDDFFRIEQFLLSKFNLEGILYVGHLESKERLGIQPAQLFNFS